MRLHCIQHVPFEGPGLIADWARGGGHAMAGTRLYAGEALPDADAFDWLVVMGGPMSVHDGDRYPWLASEKALVRDAIADGKAVLGICLGAQIIAEALGGRVYRAERKEIGWWPVYRVAAATETLAFMCFPIAIHAFHWHGETFDLPDGAVLLASSDACRNQAFTYGERVIGLQFHLEITRHGMDDLIANCADDLTAGPFVQAADEMTRDARRLETAHMTMNTLLDALSGIANRK
jgi:GMP synthase (glutamine-hydrolysing)